MAHEDFCGHTGQLNPGDLQVWPRWGMADGFIVFGWGCSVPPTSGSFPRPLLCLLHLGPVPFYGFLHSAWKPAQVPCIPLSCFPGPSQSVFSSHVGLFLMFLKKVTTSHCLGFLLFHPILQSLKSGLASQHCPPSLSWSCSGHGRSWCPSCCHIHCASFWPHLSRSLCCLWDNFLFIFQSICRGRCCHLKSMTQTRPPS